MDGRSRKVWITSSDYVSKVCDKLPSNEGRQSMVSSLIAAYGLDTKCWGIIPIVKVGRRELESFHGKEFVNEILKPRTILEQKDESNSSADENEAHDKIHDKIHVIEELEDLPNDEHLANLGLVHDCYTFEGLDEYVKLVAGSSIASARKIIAESLNSSRAICINWYGGRHHCHKNKAFGFCYVNDIVLAINTLRSTYKKIFYLDLDLHHGDGVESAFRSSKSVTTCSIHRYDVGFFPGTGSLESSKETAINIPTQKGLGDDNLMKIVTEIVLPIIDLQNPQVLVIQCGCDGLSTDRHKEWNLSIKGFGSALQHLLSETRMPVLLLGGGGYNNEEVAKCWTHLTRVALEEESDIEEMIPEHQYLDSYVDSGFAFWTPQNKRGSKMKDQNSDESINAMKEVIMNKCI